METLIDGEPHLIKRSLAQLDNFKVAVYARTSTLAQAEEEKISIPDQISWAKQLCEERGWEFIGKYVDTLPGDVEFDQRPDGYRLLEDAKFKSFNLMLFYHSSRLAREPWVGLKTISILGKLGIQVYIRNAPIEPVPPHSYIYGNNIASEYLNALSLVGDKQENIARSERVTSGFKNLAQKGILVFAGYGLKKVVKIKPTPEGKQSYTWHFEPDPVKAANVVRIFNDYLGESLRGLVKDLIRDKIPSPTGKTGLGSWSAATIKNILSNPAYIKKVRWGRKLGSKYKQGKSHTGKQKRVFTSSDKWILVEAVNVTVAIIEESLFYQVQERLRQRGKAAGRQLASDSLLVGKVWCGKCNRRAYCKTRKVKKDGKIYIRSDFIDQSYYRGLNCRRHLMSADKLEHLVLTKLQSRLNELQETDIELELSLKEEKAKETLLLSLQQSERQLKAYDTKRSRLLELYLDGDDDSRISRDQFNKLKEKIDAEQTVLLQENNRIQSLLNDQKKQKEALKTLKQLLEMFVKVTDLAVKKEMIQRIIDCVVISEDHIDVIYQYGTEGTHWLNVKPQPCGYFGDPKRSCKCMPSAILRYQKRVSGPILDRIDMHVDVPSVETQKLVIKSDSKSKIENSKVVQKRVQKARDIQTKRFKGTKLTSNNEMSTKDVKQFCSLSNKGRTMMISAASSMNLSARSYFKVVKIARTIADLASEKEISTSHLAEALQYRPKDLQL